MPSLTGAAAGTKGVRLAPLTKNAPATMTNRQIADLDDHQRVGDAGALADADDRDDAEHQHDGDGADVDDRALTEERGRQAEQLLQVARPATGHDRCAEGELEDEVPADDPGEDLADRGVGVGVGAAGGGDRRRPSRRSTGPPAG